MRGSTAGITDTLKASNPTHYAILSVLDTVFSAVVVAPAVVGYWRSVWDLMGHYGYPDDSLSGALTSTLIGLFGHTALTLYQHSFERYFNPDKNRIVYYVVSRTYTICFAFVCVNGWRGPWDLLNQYTDRNWTTVVAIMTVGLVALAAMRALRNVSAPPFAIVTDGVQGYFEVPTMFRVSVSEKTSLYILDCLFSVTVIGTLVVFVWRGAWVLLDIFLFPEDEYWSAWGSLVVGYSAVAIAFLLQPIMKWLCDHLEGASRLFVADVFLFFALIGTVNVWRGVWNLLNLYFLPDDPVMSCWITHWFCLILLILLKCSNSLLVRGVYIDAEEPAGKCVVFPCYYLRLIFQNERAKKIAKKQQLQTMSKRKQEIDNIKPCVYHIEINHVPTINHLHQSPESSHNEV